MCGRASTSTERSARYSTSRVRLIATATASAYSPGLSASSGVGLCLHGAARRGAAAAAQPPLPRPPPPAQCTPAAAAPSCCPQLLLPVHSQREDFEIDRLPQFGAVTEELSNKHMLEHAARQ